MGKETFWLAGDTRRSARGRAPKDDGCKLMFLETKDGVGILGYAGLGETSAGMEPSEWMSNCLRGRNLTLEQSLSVVAKAMEAQMPKHLLRIPKELVAHHAIIVPAFVNEEPRLYTLQLELSPNRKLKRMQFQRHRPKGGRKPPKFGLAGSGAMMLLKDAAWMRPLTRIVRAADRKQLPLHLVPKYFAQLNEQVHAADPFVGAKCIVAWRNRKKGAHKGGGGHHHLNGTAQDNGGGGGFIPTIGNGTDIIAMIAPLWENMMANVRALPPGTKELPSFDFDMDEVNAKLATMPQGPDEKLK
jgi:hypothetical protein